MKYQEIREKVLAAAQQANAMGLIHGTCGNISMRDAILRHRQAHS